MPEFRTLQIDQPSLTLPQVDQEIPERYFHLHRQGAEVTVSEHSIIQNAPDLIGIVMRTANRWIILLKRRQQIGVNQIPIQGVYVLSHLDTVSFGQQAYEFHELIERTLAEGDPLLLTHAKCTIRKRELAVGDAVVLCPSCGLPHLKEEWERNGGCGDRRVCRYRFYRAPSAT